MPIHSSYEPADSITGTNGFYYYQWGGHGKKYKYDPNDPESEQEAYQLAARQARAAHSNGYH
jgi:hypothetical protein